MRLHVGVRVLAASLATAAIAAPSAYAYPVHEAVGGGSIAPTTIQHHPGSSDNSELIALSVLGGAGVVITGYGIRRRVVADRGSVQTPAGA